MVGLMFRHEYTCIERSRECCNILRFSLNHLGYPDMKAGKHHVYVRYVVQ